LGKIGSKGVSDQFSGVSNPLSVSRRDLKADC
jgi:hypothetical protein